MESFGIRLLAPPLSNQRLHLTALYLKGSRPFVDGTTCRPQVKRGPLGSTQTLT
jgi:hypothetical protein